MPRVTYCKNSTITEAWATVIGLPAPLDETEAPVLRRAARERFEGLEPKPGFVAVSARRDLAAPFWSEQLSWSDERHLVRFGHRYLSVHFVRQESDRYQDYATTLEPTVKTWLELYSDAFKKGARDHLVNLVGFGYVNRFEFEPDDFDLSRYFKLSFGVEVGVENAALMQFDSGFRFYDTTRDMAVSVQIFVESATKEQPRVGVRTKVFAEKRGIDDMSFAATEGLLREIHTAKELAKETFFGFATEETHAIMGAVDAAAADES